PRSLRRPRRAAGERCLGGARARQAVRALDLARRPDDGPRWLPRRLRPALPGQGEEPRARCPWPGGGAGMKRVLLLLPLAIFLAIALFLYRGLFLDPSELPSALIGKPFPTFSLPAVEGERTITQADLKGKPALVN